ncbi:MAG: dihydrolipoamide acetyltransferase family protein [Haloarculaceae archaeon]
MAREFALPDVGEGVAEGELLAWRVEPGERVAEDQPVAEVETDKAVVDVPSPVDGVVRELHAEPGDVVPVGDVIVTFDVDGEAADDRADAGDAGAGSASPPDEQPATSGKPAAEQSTTPGEAEQPDEAAGGPGSENGHGDGRAFAPPSVRRLARELGVDLAAVDGSDPGGRVTAADVRAVARDATSGEREQAESTAGERPESRDSAAEAGAESAPGTGAEDAPGTADTTGAETGADSAAGGVEERPATGTRGGAPGGTATGTRTAVERADRDRTLAAPATRRVARELDVDIDEVPAVERRDGEAFVDETAVREYAEVQRRAQAADAAAVEAGDEGAGGAAGPVREGERGAPAGERRAAAGGERERREPYRGVRKTIGEAMERSKFTAPHVTHHDRADATALVAARERLRPRAERAGVNLTYLPFVLKAVVAALREHPVLNTSLDEESDEIVYKNYYDIGVATATDAGLMVPVVEDVDGKGLVELASDVTELTAKARDRSIDLEDLRGSTFSVTNFGVVGGEYATPIINYPETAILGLGAIEKRPAVVDGEVVARETLPLSLSIDHRVIDGADAARFVNTLVEYLEEPTLLLLE